MAEPSPYSVMARAYVAAGWLGVLPLPRGQKSPVPEGFTGKRYYEVDPTSADIEHWINAPEWAGANIGLRMPRDVIGIDVDDYDDKPGAASFAKALDEYGPLPPTWSLSSREGGQSGIRFYRVPEGLKWPNSVGPGIETIHRGHRYAVAFPSVHPKTKRIYMWRRPDGSASLECPRPSALPELPDAWISGLTKGELAGPATAHSDVPEAAGGWLSPGHMCALVRRQLMRVSSAMDDAGSRHDNVRDLVLSILHLGQQGHSGVAEALDTARGWFVDEVGKDRGASTAEREFDSFLTGAYEIVAASPREPEPCTGGDDCAGHWVAAEGNNLSQYDFPIIEPPARKEPGPDGPEAADDAVEAELIFNREVSTELHRIRVRETAKELFRTEQLPPAPPFDLDTLGSILERPAPAPDRVAGLIPADAGTLIVAQRKTGKTTLCLNAARCLLTGEMLLERFNVIDPITGTVAIFNYEVSAHQLARWADNIGVPQDRLLLVNLRGRRNPLSNPEDRVKLAEQLRDRNVESLFVDPFGRAYSGTSQNDAGEVTAWLTSLDEFARSEVGARDLILTVHAGWNGERTRGSSALEDWADSMIYLTHSDEDESQRFLRAEGRDVDVAEDRLEFNPATRLLRMTGEGSRKEARDAHKHAELAVYVVRAAFNSPGINVSGISRAIKSMEDAPRFRADDIQKAIALAVQQRQLRIEDDGPGKAKRHYVMGAKL